MTRILTKFYLDIESLVLLLFEKYRLTLFDFFLKYLIFNGKRLRYKRIGAEVLYIRDYIKLDIIIYTIIKKELLILSELYIIFNLSYDIIINIDILKFNNIYI